MRCVPLNACGWVAANLLNQSGVRACPSPVHTAVVLSVGSSAEHRFETPRMNCYCTLAGGKMAELADPRPSAWPGRVHFADGDGDRSGYSRNPSAGCDSAGPLPLSIGAINVSLSGEPVPRRDMSSGSTETMSASLRGSVPSFRYRSTPGSDIASRDADVHERISKSEHDHAESSMFAVPRPALPFPVSSLSTPSRLVA